MASQNPTRIRKVMREHIVQTIHDPHHYDADYSFNLTRGAFSFNDWRPKWILGWARPHRIHTFQLGPTGAGGNTIAARYIPLTQRSVWNGDVNRANQAAANARFVDPPPAPGLSVTGRLSGCFMIRKSKRQHRPPATPLGNPAARSTADEQSGAGKIGGATFGMVGIRPQGI